MESEASSATARGALLLTAMPANGGSFAETSQMQTLHKQLQSALKEIGMLRQQALAESQSQTSLSGLDGEPGVSGMPLRITLKGTITYTMLPSLQMHTVHIYR